MSESKILRLRSTVLDLENQAKAKREQARMLFECIREKLIEREAAVMKAISKSLDYETRAHRRLIMLLEK